MREVQSWLSQCKLESQQPEPRVSKGQGWVCRRVGGTVPGCALSAFHAGLGDKPLFLTAPSHALTLLTHSHSCQSHREAVIHARTRLLQGKAAPATDFLHSATCAWRCPWRPLHLRWVLPPGAQDMCVRPSTGTSLCGDLCGAGQTCRSGLRQTEIGLR